MGQVTETELAAMARAPRVTFSDVVDNIASTHYFTAAEGVQGRRDVPLPAMSIASAEALRLLTFCVMVLKNGFTVVGKSACASPENFDAEMGQRIAREDAIRQVWPLMGYELRSNLHALAKLRAQEQA